MADGTPVSIPDPGPGVEDIDTHEVDYGGGDIRKKQRMLVTGPGPNTDAAVLATKPGASDNGLVVRQAGDVDVHLVDENGVVFSEAHPLPVNVGDLTVQQLTVSFPDSVISTANTTTTALGANQTFTGGWEEITKFAGISAIVFTDQPSALNGAVVQFSHDGSTAARSVAATIPANTGLTFMFGPEARYFRVLYTNGPTAQTVLHSQVILHYQTPSPPQLPLAATTTDLTLAESVMSHVKGRQTNGVYIPLRADATGRLDVTDEQVLAALQDLAGHEIPLSNVDPGNLHSAAFAANETWTGAWTAYGPIPGMITLVLMDSQPTSVDIEWSADGINKDTSILGTTPFLIQQSTTIPGAWSATFVNNLPVNAYYRLKIVNGPTPGASFGHARVWRLRAPFGGNFSPVASAPTNFSVALLTRAIQSGITPDGSFTNIPIGGHDPDNFTSTLLGANASFVGNYKSAQGINSMLVFAITDQPLTTARIEWSPDGVNPNTTIIGTSDLIGTVQVFDNPTAGPGAKVYIYLSVLTTVIDKHYRLRLVNGPAANTLFTEADVWVYDKPFTGSFGSLTGNLSSISTALLTRAVQAGTLPDKTFKNAVYGGVDPSQSPQLVTPTPVLLGVGQTFTAPWSNVEGFADVSAMVLADVDGTAFFDYSMDGVTQDRTFAYPIKGGMNADWISAAPRGKFFRFRYLNDGTAQTVFKAQIVYATTPVGDQFGRLATSPTDDTIVATTKSINAGRRPDGIYVNQPETGVSAANNTSAILLANATWVGTWENCDQYSDVAVNVRSDVSGTVVMDFSQDATTVDRQTTFLYAQAPVGSTFAVPVQARYCRISYINAGVNQTLMRLQTRLLEEGLDGATMPLVEAITDATMAQVERAVLSGKGNDGLYHNVMTSNTGGIRADVESLPVCLFGTYAVGLSASQLVTTGFANRRTVSFKADPGNSGVVYIGTTSSVLATNGYPLSAGDSVEIDAATGISFWAIGSKAGQRVATIEVGVA